NMEFRATYRKEINDFDMNLSEGTISTRQLGKSKYIGGVNLSVPGLYRISNIPVGNRQADNHTYEKLTYGVYGMASVGFQDKLYIDVTARNDWSSTLPKNNRSYFYPSASLSWLVNNTVELPSAISFLKV